eukprot:UN13365
MKNSVIKDIKIVIEDAHFYAKHCTYTITSTSTDNLAIVWLDVGSPYNFTVLGCTFNTCGDSAIEIEACHKAQSENTGNIRIIGNLFKGKCLKSSMIALNPDVPNVLIHMYSTRDITDWNEGVLRIHFSTPTQIEFNVIVGYGCGHINANEIKPKPLPIAI